ncbi:MAG TPA: glycosyltransferase [Candidatus Competibacter sp.]|nr:glycosyltransferase [Candidatus Competibacter sp.]
MKLLHIVPTYLPATRYGGPIYSVHGLCKALVARGHEVHVFTTNVDGPDDSPVPLGRPIDLDGVKVWYFPARRLRRLYWSPPMWEALRREIGGIDRVHLHSVFLWPTWAAARAARAAGVPYVLSPRGMLVQDLIRRKSRWLKTAWIALIERRNLERAAAIHVTSVTEADDLRPFGFHLPPVIVVPNGIEPPESVTGRPVSAAVESIVAHQPLILFLSRIHWKKGLDRLIPALAEIPVARLAIVGNDEEDYLPELQQLAAAHEVAERITFLPRSVGGADKEALFTAAKVFVLPSYSENFGNVVLEALARGCPALVTPKVGAAEVVRASGGGVVVEGDPKALARAISALIENPLRLEIGQRGQRHIAAHFTWNGIAERMEILYQDRAVS